MFPTRRLYLGGPPRYINGCPCIYSKSFWNYCNVFIRHRERQRPGSINYWTIRPCSTPLYRLSHMLCRKTARVTNRYVLWSNIPPVNTLIGMCQWFVQARQCTRFMQRVSIGNITDDKLPPHVAHPLL